MASNTLSAHTLRSRLLPTQNTCEGKQPENLATHACGIPVASTTAQTATRGFDPRHHEQQRLNFGHSRLRSPPGDSQLARL